MKRVFLVFLVLGLVGFLGLAGIILLFGMTRWTASERIPARTVLELNLESGFIENVPNDATASLLFKSRATLRDLVEALEKAGTDDRVMGLVAHVGGGGSGMGMVQEIRDAVKGFRERGKFAVAFAETFGEGSPGNIGYYMAAAFDEIWLQPSGDVNLTGLMAETLFIRDALKKLGVTPRFDHRKEYKNAMNLFTDTRMSAAQREATGALIQSQFRQIVRGIVQDRRMNETAVRTRFDHGPLTGRQALEAGLVDELGYWDQVRDHVLKKTGSDSATLLPVAKYLRRAGRPHTRGTTVALIYGVGEIQRGTSGYNPVFGDVSMGSSTVAGAFRDAIKDDNVKGILFRVDSPGGSAVASDTIWRETIRARDAGKPVVVSMGNVAASGGYWISMNAAKIVAQPGTITASIGVLSGKFLTGPFWNWLGVNWDDVHTSRFSTYFSSSYDYTEEGWKTFEAGLDRIYNDFTEKVAAGRHMPIEKVREVARGRIWTGEDALERGLVDELGGFPAALRLLRKEMGLAETDPLRIKLFPREKSAWQRLAGSFLHDDATGPAAALARALQEIQPLARAARPTRSAGRAAPG
ncbi:MAG: signal peptide peptidase SppA, partial [Acidobacteriota bacterium]